MLAFALRARIALFIGPVWAASVMLSGCFTTSCNLIGLYLAAFQMRLSVITNLPEPVAGRWLLSTSRAPPFVLVSFLDADVCSF